MYINTFKYTPKDVSCQLCTEYVKKLGCTALRCPWLAERIEAGVVGYREAVLETFPHERRLFQRLNLLIKHYPGSLWSNEQHERRMQYQCAVQGYRRRRDTNAYYAAMYLLTSNDDIYRRTANCFCKDGIEFGYAVLKNTSPHNYALFMAARDLCDKTEAVTMADLAEPEVIDPEALRLIVNATLIARYGLARGNNGLIKTKYLTFGVEADNLRAAKPRLERIETDLLNNFKRLGVVAAPLNGFERLHVMHDILRMDEQEPFRFSWDWLPPSGLSTKDFIAPSSFEFKTGRMFRMGKKLGAISFVQILAPELNDRMLADFLDMESSVLVNLHVQSVDQVNAIKTVKRKITDLDKSKIEEQKKAVRAGYDMDIIPSDLATYGAEAKKLLQDLQSRNERITR